MNEAKLKQLPVQAGIRQRGLDTTRLETFLDAAFAFATTMLVISIGDIPQSYAELVTALKGAPAFFGSFAAIMIFWLGHRKWSRMYGLENTATVIISLLLIFVLLVYVYPLRLMFSAMLSWMTLGWLPSEFSVTTVSEITGLFVVYGLGLSLLSLCMALLYRQAYVARKELLLNAYELLRTKAEFVLWIVLSLTGLTSIIIATLFPPGIAVYAGFTYFTLPVSMPVTNYIFLRKGRELLKDQ